MKKPVNTDELQSLPNIGPKLEEKLHLIGIRTVDQFMAKDPVTMYKEIGNRLGCHVDPCVLYAFKGAQINMPWPQCKQYYTK